MEIFFFFLFSWIILSGFNELNPSLICVEVCENPEIECGILRKYSAHVYLPVCSFFSVLRRWEIFNSFLEFFSSFLEFLTPFWSFFAPFEVFWMSQWGQKKKKSWKKKNQSLDLWRPCSASWSLAFVNKKKRVIWTFILLFQSCLNLTWLILTFQRWT